MTIALWFILTANLVSIVASFHTVVWTKCATWHRGNGALLYRLDLDAYNARKANPPWFIRYDQWLDRVVPRKNRP